MPALLPNNNISRVQAGSPTIIKFDLGNTIDKIKLELLNGLTAAMIDRVQLRTDGRMVYESTGLNMLKESAYKNQTLAANTLVLDFTEPYARNGATEQLMASIPTNLLTDLSLEILVSITAPATANIKCHSLVRPPTQNPYILKKFRHAFDVKAIGTNSLYLPTGALGAVIKRMYIFEAVQNQIAGIEMLVNNARMTEISRANYEAEAVTNKLVPQPKLLVLDFVQDGNMNGAISTQTPKGSQAPNVEFRVDATAPGLVEIYFEIVDHINRR